ncbi:alpha-galactosidase [bacterium]|nr:alpha-galactosidase [bacterium]
MNLSLRKAMLFTTGCLAIVSIAPGEYSEYDARIGKKEILTPAPAKFPRINGPKVYGARPGKQFIYRLPTQGERPIQFAVQGLPDSLKLDAGKGIITGVTPATKGDYPMTFVAKNALGKAERAFKLVVGDRMALTPPTGWNHWGGHASNINDGIIRAAADLFVERGLADVGFQYVSIDDGWPRLSPKDYRIKVIDPGNERYIRIKKGIDFDKVVGEPRDANGNILPNGYFPDMKALTDYIHSFGLKAGIYSSPGRHTCNSLTGSCEHEQQDAEQYAEWGFDLLKYDMCTGVGVLGGLRKETPGLHQKEFWRPMAEYLRATDRDFLMNLCQYGKEDPWEWAPEIGYHTWRIGGDLNKKVQTYFDVALRAATECREYSKPGQWNDPDFLHVGHQVNTSGNHFEPSKPCALSTNQEYQYVTLWSIICAPFFVSNDVLNVSDFTIGLLSNADVLNINQDELGHVAKVLRNEEGREAVMVKNLANGSRALGVFNRNSEQERVVEVGWDEIGESGEKKVYDVWRQKDLGTRAGGISVRLSPNGVGLFVVQ